MYSDIRINSAGKTFCAPDWRWDTQDFIRDFDIWTPLKGRGSIKTGDCTYPISPGDCFVLRPYERYVFEQDFGYPFVVVYIHFDYINSGGDKAIPPGSSMPAFHRRIGSPVFFGELLQRVISAFRRGSAGAAETKQWMKAVLTELHSYDTKPVYSGVELEQAAMIDAVCDSIASDPAGCDDISRLAAGYSYTPDHFCRLFKKFKGVTPSQHIISTRVDQAKALLKASSYSIGRISEILGYHDIYHFSRQFHQKTGMTPSEFRKG